MHYNSRRPKNGLTEWKVNALRPQDWLWLLRRSVNVFSTKPESGSFKGKIFKFHAEVEYIFFTSEIRTFQFAFWNQYCSHQTSWLEPACCMKWQNIVPDQLLVCGVGDLWRTWRIPNWFWMSISYSHDHLESIWYHSEPSKGAYFPNQ